MRVRGLDDTVDRYNLGCIRTYLEGEQAWEWVSGCVGRSGANAERIHAAIVRTRGYGDLARWEWLREFYCVATAEP